MTDLVPTEDIERIVGIDRHPTGHFGRAVSADETVYILHSRECLDSGIDLRDCRFSIALDEGIWEQDWADHEDIPVCLMILQDRLVPVRIDQ